LHLHLVFCIHDSPISEIYTLSLHDALPILLRMRWPGKIKAIEPPISSLWGLRTWAASSVKNCSTSLGSVFSMRRSRSEWKPTFSDRKSTRLNSSHLGISYAVFCLKKKNITQSDAIPCVLLVSVGRTSYGFAFLDRSRGLQQRIFDPVIALLYVCDELHQPPGLAC